MQISKLLAPDLEETLRQDPAQAAELAERECKKLRLLVARRWKMVGPAAR